MPAHLVLTVVRTTFGVTTMCHLIPGQILGLRPANDRPTSLQSNAVFHWLGANLESALQFCSLPQLACTCHALVLLWVSSMCFSTDVQNKISLATLEGVQCSDYGCLSVSSVQQLYSLLQDGWTYHVLVPLTVGTQTTPTVATSWFALTWAYPCMRWCSVLPAQLDSSSTLPSSAVTTPSTCQAVAVGLLCHPHCHRQQLLAQEELRKALRPRKTPQPSPQQPQQPQPPPQPQRRERPPRMTTITWASRVNQDYM